VACGSSPSRDNTASTASLYSENLTFLVGTLVESDTEKRQVMEIYEELGGSEASLQRGLESCEILSQGETVNELAMKQHQYAGRDLGFSASNRALNDREMEKLTLALKLYNAEVYAAQSSICPETEVELEF
jgi:hypothetical protein